MSLNKINIIFILAIFSSNFPNLLAQYNYSEVLEKSLLFYEVQRTGKLPINNRIPWRGDSFLNDRGQSGEDLTGGYFDAGDFVKFGFPFASAMTMFAWGLVEHKEGFLRAGQYDYALDALKWGTDYMIKAHPSPNEFYVQVGDPVEDHAYWGRPEEWPENKIRPTLKCTISKPGSEVAAESAASLAAASIVFKEAGEIEYAEILLSHSEELYQFANNYRAKYSDSFPETEDYYKSWSGYGDELGWSAAWLYRATDKALYGDAVSDHWREFSLSTRPAELSWDNKVAGVQILMAKLTGQSQYVSAADAFCTWVRDIAPKSPKGFIFLSEWGSLRHTANAVFACMTYKDEFWAMGQSQIHYMLGSSGRSFVCGFGDNPPQSPHHASSSCRPTPDTCNWDDFSKPEANYHVLYGALVGGPDINDNYEDDRTNYVTNEVTLDYNAGFQSAVAALNSK